MSKNYNQKDHPEDKQKRGPFSREEKLYILENMEISDDDLAKELKRNPEHISTIKVQHEVIKKDIEKEDFITALHAEHFWTETKAKLLPEEIEYFEKQWGDLCLQFSVQGILATEKLMIQDLIIQEILLGRNLKEEKSIRLEMRRLDEDLTTMTDKHRKKKPNEAPISPDIKYLQKTLDGHRATLITLQRGHGDLQKNKDAKFRDLKGTRAQRLDKIEKGGKNFFDMIKLLDEKEAREKEGRLLAIAKKGAEIKAGELMEYFEYENKVVDRPLLIPEHCNED